MGKKVDLDPRTATFNGTQLGYEVGGHKQVTNAKEILKSSSSLSLLSQIKLFLEIENKKRNAPKNFIPKLKDVPAIYAGLQIHEFLTILQIHERLASLKVERNAELFRPYAPKEDDRRVRQHVYGLAPAEHIHRLSKGSKLPAFYHQAKFSFDQWMSLQSFLVAEVPPLYRQSGLFRHGVREHIWAGNGDLGRENFAIVQGVIGNIEQILSTGHHVVMDPRNTDALFETPICLQVYEQDRRARTVTWVQPDQVIRKEDGSILVIDVKSENELERIPKYDEWDWLELLLSCVAGKLIAEFCIEQPRLETSLDKPLRETNLNLWDLYDLAQNVNMEFLIPQIIDDKTETLMRIPVTLESEQMSKALELYGRVISELGDEHRKREFKQFKDSRDNQGEALSPKPLLTKEVMVQRLLMYVPIYYESKIR